MRAVTTWWHISKPDESAKGVIVKGVDSKKICISSGSPSSRLRYHEVKNDKPLFWLFPEAVQKYPIFFGFKSLPTKGGLASGGVGTCRIGSGGALLVIGGVTPGIKGMRGGSESPWGAAIGSGNGVALDNAARVASRNIKLGIVIEVVEDGGIWGDCWWEWWAGSNRFTGWEDILIDQCPCGLLHEYWDSLSATVVTIVAQNVGCMFLRCRHLSWAWEGKIRYQV